MINVVDTTRLRSFLKTSAAIACMCMTFVSALSANEEERFDIFEYRVLGNSVLPAIELETTLYPLLGEHKTLTDVEQARTTLERLYKDRGYGTVFVDIPEQSVADGIVRLNVTEGTINRVQVTGSRFFSNREIRAAVPAAQPGVVPHLPTVQDEITALNRQTSDRSVVPVMRAGPRPGTVDLRLQVSDELPVHGSVEVNNQYTKDTSKIRTAASVSYDHVLARMDSLAVQYQTSPEELEEVSVWAGSYTTRLPDGLSKLALFFISSDSDVATVGDADASISVLGRGKIFGARYVNPFHSDAASTHVFIGSAEYKDFEESVFSEDFLRTPISYVNLSAGHTSAWRFDRQQFALASSVGFGVRGMANSSEEFRIKRSHGNPNYWVLRMDGSWSRVLPWNMSARLRAAGQYALEPIISNEQFSIAGADGTRGYLEAEQLGDVGIKSSFEFGLPPLRLLTERINIGTFLFYDFGRMTRIEPLRALTGELTETPDHTLRSAGAGLEFNAFDFLTGSLSWAYPLADGAAGSTRKGDSRIHFLIRATW